VRSGFARRRNILDDGCAALSLVRPSGVQDRGMPPSRALAAGPVFAWEMSLAGWMIAKGFKPSPSLGSASRPVDLGSRLATVSSY
jgi:hypothetical protein